MANENPQELMEIAREVFPDIDDLQPLDEVEQLFRMDMESVPPGAPEPVPIQDNALEHHIAEVQAQLQLTELHLQGVRRYAADLRQVVPPPPALIAAQQNLAQLHLASVQQFSAHLREMQAAPMDVQHDEPVPLPVQPVQPLHPGGKPRYLRYGQHGRGKPQLRRPSPEAVADVQRHEDQAERPVRQRRQRRQSDQQRPQQQLPAVPEPANVRRLGRPAEYHPRADGRFHCPQCTRHFKKANGLRNHIRSYHEHAYVCREDDRCGQVLANSTTRRNHEAMHRPPPRANQCPYCTFSCDDGPHFTQHIRAAHQNRRN